MKKIIYLCLISIIFVACQSRPGGEQQENDDQEQTDQAFQPNYDESEVPEYTLPPLLTDPQGNEVTTVAAWENNRKPWIYEKFANQVYGKKPGKPDTLIFQIQQEVANALSGKARAKEVKVFFTKDRDPQYSMNLLIYLPKNTSTPAPVFLGLNFYGNQTITNDTFVDINPNWMRSNEDFGIVNHRATEDSRGVRVNRWPLEMIVDAGYGLATIYCGDLDPDKADPVDWQDGIHPMFFRENQVKPDSNQMATIGAWSWGLSRAVDYFETDEAINHEKIAVMGHSRLGKASLWAGANDPRFSIVISNNSGCGGAALSRRAFGETIKRINTSFPHWFCKNFHTYSNNEAELPIDQHMLLALIAPRALYVASAEDDQWADPKGEFLSAVHASEVYELYDEKGLTTTEMPAVNHPLQNGKVAYHLRSGVHDVTDFDWEQYIKFAGEQW